MSDDGKDLLGMAQRFGPYSFVVNTDKVSRDGGRAGLLFADPALAGEYGILESDDWNVFGIFMVAGINPFKEHTDAEMKLFSETAEKVFKGAKMVGDIASLNQALVSGEIDLHLTGGTYSVSPARADGYLNLRAVTLKWADRWQGRDFAVDRNHLDRQQSRPFAACHRVPEICAGTEVAHTVAFAEGTFNPVSQMGNKKCFDLFTKDELKLFSGIALRKKMACLAEYDIVPDYEKGAGPDDRRQASAWLSAERIYPKAE